MPRAVIFGLGLLSCAAGCGQAPPSPEKTFKEFQAALAGGDSEKAWNLLTQETRDALVLEANFTSGWASNGEQSTNPQLREAVARRAESFGISVSDLKTLNGPKYFGILAARARGGGESPMELLVGGDLQSVSVKGQLKIWATGLVFGKHSSMDLDFRRAKDGEPWLISISDVRSIASRPTAQPETIKSIPSVPSAKTEVAPVDSASAKPNEPFVADLTTPEKAVESFLKAGELDGAQGWEHVADTMVPSDGKGMREVAAAARDAEKAVSAMMDAMDAQWGPDPAMRQRVAPLYRIPPASGFARLQKHEIVKTDRDGEDKATVTVRVVRQAAGKAAFTIETPFALLRDKGVWRVGLMRPQEYSQMLRPCRAVVRVSETLMSHLRRGVYQTRRNAMDGLNEELENEKKAGAY